MQEFHIKTIIFLIISLSIEIILLVICKTHQLDLYETYKVLMFDGCTCTAVYVVKYYQIGYLFISGSSFQEILTTSSMLISSVAASK